MGSASARPERVVLDTNVLASALAFGGVPQVVLGLGRAGEFDVYSSPFILGELSGVLASRKFRWERGEIEGALRELRSFITVIEPPTGVVSITADIQDNRILECGLAASAAVIITGNMKHIRPLGSFQGIAILTPREFIDRFFPAL